LQIKHTKVQGKVHHK